VTAAFGKLAYKAAGDWANARQQEEQARCGAGNACPIWWPWTRFRIESWQSK
jgi:hypothetical protein